MGRPPRSDKFGFRHASEPAASRTLWRWRRVPGGGCSSDSSELRVSGRPRLLPPPSLPLFCFPFPSPSLPRPRRPDPEEAAAAAAAEFSVKVSGVSAAAERSPLRWPPPLAASCRVVQNGGRRRSRAGRPSSASGPPRNPWPLLSCPCRPRRGELQCGLDRRAAGTRARGPRRRASVAGLAPRRQGRGPRQGPAVGAGPARRTSPEPGLPAGRRCVGPAAGRRARERRRTGLPCPLWAAAAEALSAAGFMEAAAGRQEAAFLRENKGPARRGRLPPRPEPSLGPCRKPGQTGPGGGTRCSFVRAEWGGGACCHIVAPAFRRLSTRARWEGVKGRAEEKAVQPRVMSLWPPCHHPDRTY